MLATYCGLSFLYFGLRLVLESGRQYVGGFDDPQILIWSFAWWPHAILHGQNPFVTHVLWPPGGVNLAWVNAVPGLALLFSPLTLTLGPVVSYNVAAVLMPALAAWAAFLLCHYLTRSLWPSLVGGYLYGFSAYMLGHEGVQLQLVAVFVLPLVALIVVRYVDDDLSSRTLVLSLGPLLAFQILTSTEFAFTLTLALACALALAWMFVRDKRPRLRSLLAPLAGAYAVAAALTAPFLYYTVTGFRFSAFNPPEQYEADLANLIVPTHLQAFGAGWAQVISDQFPGNYAERGAFLGLPVLAIVGLFAWRRWQTAGGRFLVAALCLAVYAALGPDLTVVGHRLLPLPTILGHNRLALPGLGSHLVPLFNNVLPTRIMLYASLVSVVIVAIWMASSPAGRILRWALPALAVLMLVPNPAAGIWATTYTIPPFFTDSAYRSCLRPGEVILPEPVTQGGMSLLWQVTSDFRFRMTGGRVQLSPPTEFLHPQSIAQIAVGYPPVADQTQLFTAFFKKKGVTSVILDKSRALIWAPALDRIAKRQDVGGILLYRVSGEPRACPTTER